MTSQRDASARSDASRPRGASRFAALALVAALGVAAVLGISAAYRFSHRAPAAAASGSAPSARLLVTRDFGSQTLFDRGVRVSASASVMDVLRRNVRVDTAYGGGFVNAIDGVASGYTGGGAQRADWFFLVNGFQSSQGAADRHIAATDRVWWDFHRWDFAPSVPAVVGQFPEPFAGGGSAKTLPTTVAFSRGCAAQADIVAQAMRANGVARVTVAPLGASDPTSPEHHTVLVGVWRDLARLPAVSQAAENPSASGLFARFDDAGRLVTLDSLGVAHTQAAGAGAVLATARADAPEAAIWLVTGGNGPGVSAAARLLEHEPRALAGRFGVAVDARGAVAALPAAVAK